MSVTPSLVIFIGYLEFRDQVVPSVSSWRSVKGSGSGANLSPLMTSFITGDNSVE